MATHRRTLASMEPTHQRYPMSTTKPHPTPPPPQDHQDLPLPPPTTSIQSISNHFSKLYTNHKILKSLKGSSVDTHLQAKAMAVSSNFDSSSTTTTTTLTKSKSQHVRRPSTTYIPQKEVTKTKVVKEKVIKESIEKPKPSSVKQKIYEIKTPSSKKEPNDKDFDAEKQDMKRASLALVPLATNGGGGGGGGLGGGRRRKSFCSSQNELADFFSCNGVKVVSVDMPPFMQMHAVDCARKTFDSLEKFTAKTLASTLKKEFDEVYGPAWHCIVGTSFGSFVTHSVGGFMYFSMDQKLYILLFKTTVQKVE